MEDLGDTGRSKRGGTIRHVQYSMVSGRQVEVGRPLVTNRSGGERRQIDWRDVSKEATKVVTGTVTMTVTVTVTVTVTATAMDVAVTTEEEWEYPPAARGIGQDRGRYTPRAVTGRGPGVPTPREH